MKRYFFNICGDSYEEVDIVGKAFPDDVAALGEAMNVAGRVVQRRLLADAISYAGSVEVEDEQHRRVLSLPLRAAAY